MFLKYLFMSLSQDFLHFYIALLCFHIEYLRFTTHFNCHDECCSSLLTNASKDSLELSILQTNIFLLFFIFAASCKCTLLLWPKSMSKMIQKRFRSRLCFLATLTFYVSEWWILFFIDRTIVMIFHVFDFH